MPVIKTVALVFMGLLLALPGWAGEGMENGFCAEVITRGTGGGARGDELVEGREFSVRKIEDLQLEVMFHTAIEGDHLMELDLISPRGHLYQRLTVPITSDGGQRGASRDVARYPRPLKVEVLDEVTTREGVRQVATVSLPVAGTTIQSSSLYGPWLIDVKVDGQGPTCLIINRFSLIE